MIILFVDVGVRRDFWRIIVIVVVCGGFEKNVYYILLLCFLIKFLGVDVVVFVVVIMVVSID